MPGDAADTHTHTSVSVVVYPSQAVAGFRGPYMRGPYVRTAAASCVSTKSSATESGEGRVHCGQCPLSPPPPLLNIHRTMCLGQA